MVTSLNRFSSLFIRIAAVAVTIALASCGGGGGGDGTDDRGAVGGSHYLVEANVVRDSCGERLSNVRQVFTVNGDLVDTSLVTVQGVEADGGVQASYSESNGDCTRTYQFTLANLGANGSATLLSHTQCGATVCETEWQGTLSPTTATKAAEINGSLRVNGERCNANVPTEVGYRPSLFECNGNSAILLSGSQRNNYSVVVRRNGQFNDRDPNNPSCGTNRCSPYKTQKRIELSPYQVNCLGGSGYSSEYADVQRISIKYTAQVTNPSDTSQFEQYCLTNTEVSFN